MIALQGIEWRHILQCPSISGWQRLTGKLTTSIASMLSVRLLHKLQHDSSIAYVLLTALTFEYNPFCNTPINTATCLRLLNIFFRRLKLNL